MYGHIVLASTKGEFVPSAIEWFTDSKFSHSFITMPDMLNIPMCIEAASGGVDFTRFDTGYVSNPSQSYEVWEVLVADNVKDTALTSMLNELEIGYGYLHYPWFIWRKICSIFGKDIKNQNNWDQKGMICSQLCVAYMTDCGLSDVLSGYGQGAVAPQDLKNIFLAHPDKFKLVGVKA